MQSSSSFSKLPASFTRVNDVPVLLEDDRYSPSKLSSSNSPALCDDLDDYLHSGSGNRTIALDRRPQTSSGSNIASLVVKPQVFQVPRIGGKINTPIASTSSSKGAKVATQRLESMIANVVEKGDAAKRIIAKTKKKATPAGKRTEEEEKKALKHTSVDLSDDNSDDEEEIEPENEEDRAFIDDGPEDGSECTEESGEDSSDDDTDILDSDVLEISEGEESAIEQEVELLNNLISEDEKYSDEEEGWVPAHKFASEDEKLMQEIATERKFLKPIDMTYVPGLSMGGYGACTIKNMLVMITNSAMQEFYTYIPIEVPRVQAILTATTEFTNNIPISKGSTEGTVMAYRLWLHTRERVRVAARKFYADCPEMVGFLDCLPGPFLIDSFFFVKKDFPVETCCITGRPTDVGFEIVSAVNHMGVSTLWFDRNDEIVADVCINFLRFWFLPFTLRSFVDSKVRSKWPTNPDLTRRKLNENYIDRIQPTVYANIKALVESVVATMRFFNMKVTENTELSFS